MNVTVDLTVESAAWSTLPDLAGLTERAVDAALAEAGAALPGGCEISCLFSDDATIRGLNARWRGIDAPTNVLSFPAAGGTPVPGALLGDIALAFETVEREASRDRKRVDHHTSHLVVHGTLHLLGFDHQDDDEALAMEAIERRAMRRLGAPDPYAESDASDEA